MEQLQARVIIHLSGEKPTTAPYRQALSCRVLVLQPVGGCWHPLPEPPSVPTLSQKKIGPKDGVVWITETCTWNFTWWWGLQKALQNTQNCQMSKKLEYTRILWGKSLFKPSLMLSLRSHLREHFLMPYGLRLLIAEGWAVSPQLHLAALLMWRVVEHRPALVSKCCWSASAMSPGVVSCQKQDAERWDL